MALNVAELAPSFSQDEFQSRAGRGVSEETLAAQGWLQQSWDNGDGETGAPMEIVIPVGNVEEIIKLLSRAAANLGLGKDAQTTPLKGGKVKILYRARIKRERKTADV